MRTWFVVIAVLLAATSALAHHSNSAFDPEKVVVLKGTVTEWRWTNPHVWIFLSVDDGKGGKDGVGDRGPPPRHIGPFRVVEEHIQARRHDHRGFQPGEGRQPHRSHHARHARRWHRALTGDASVIAAEGRTSCRRPLLCFPWRSYACCLDRRHRFARRRRRRIRIFPACTIRLTRTRRQPRRAVRGRRRDP